MCVAAGNREKFNKTPYFRGLMSSMLTPLRSSLLVSRPGSDSFRSKTYVLAQIIFSLFQREISEMCRPIGVRFCTLIRIRPNFIMPIKNLKPPSFPLPPKKFQEPKTCKIWPDFGRLQNFAANISETDKDIQNRTSTFCTTISLVFGEEKLVNFDLLPLEK